MYINTYQCTPYRLCKKIHNSHDSNSFSQSKVKLRFINLIELFTYTRTIFRL